MTFGYQGPMDDVGLSAAATAAAAAVGSGCDRRRGRLPVAGSAERDFREISIDRSDAARGAGRRKTVTIVNRNAKKRRVDGTIFRGAREIPNHFFTFSPPVHPQIFPPPHQGRPAAVSSRSDSVLKEERPLYLLDPYRYWKIFFRPWSFVWARHDTVDTYVKAFFKTLTMFEQDESL